MRSAALLLSCLAAELVSGALAWTHVGPQELAKTLEESDFALVAFVLPSEEKSKALEEEWTSAAADSKDPLVSVDCATEAKLCNTYGVDSYPTIKLFQRDDAGGIEYPGPRRAGALLNFIGRFKRPVVSEVTADNLQAFKIVDDTVFIGYISPEDEAARQAFAEVARNRRDEFSFGIASDPEVIAGEGLKSSSPAVVCYRRLDRDSKALPPFADDAAELDRLVLEASRPVIGELMPYNHQRLLDRGWPMIYIFAPTEPERARLRMELAKFARGYYDTLTSVTVDPLYFPDLPARLGLEPGGVYPAGAVHQLSRDRVYPYPRGRPIDSRSLQGWGLDVYQGRIRPWTPPGVTTSTDDDDLGPTRAATRRVSVASGWAGAANVKIKVAGHDEL